jgi:PAS domain S-box-containing protein
VLLGRWTSFEPLTRLVPGSLPVRPWSAVGFASAGLALAALARGKTVVARGLALASAALGATPLVRDLLGVDGADEARIAPRVAVGVALTGVAVAWTSFASFRPTARVRPLGVALLGAATLALGATSMLGHLVGVDHAYVGTGGVPLAFAGAAALATLGVGVLSLARGGPGEEGGGVGMTPLAVAVAALVSALLLGQALAAQEAQRVHDRLGGRARALARHVDERIAAAAQRVLRLAAVALASPEGESDARAEASATLEQAPGIAAFARHARGAVEWSVVGTGYVVDLAALDEALDALPLPARPASGRLGDRAQMWLAVPAAPRGGGGPARLVAVVDLPARLSTPVVEALGERDEVELQEAGRRVAVFGAPAGKDALEAGAHVNVWGTRHPWRLVVRVGASSGRSPLPWIAGLGVSVLGALAAAALHLGERAQRRARDAERASDKLLLEVHHRRRVEEERDAFFAASPDVTFVVDGSGRILQANDACRETLGLSSDDLGAVRMDLVHPDDRAATENAVATVLREGRVSWFENRCRGAAGWRRLQWSAVLAPKTGRVHAVARDVTEAHAVGKALRDREAQFRAVAESAQDAIVCVDRGGTVAYANGAAARLFGRDARAFRGLPVSVLVPERLREPYRARVEAYATVAGAAQVGRTVEVVGLRADGTEFPVEMSVASFESEGAPVFAGILRDVTERKRAEAALRRYAAELRRSNAELQQFAYVASHDLQEPLRMVASYTDLLAKRYADRLDADAHEFIGYAVDGARRMQRLIQDLLEFARVETRGRAFEPVPSGRALDVALGDLRARIEEAGARVERGDLPVVHADEGQLATLFQNLVGNAVKFRGEEPPVVHVSAERGDGEWTFTVSDNGIGIEPEHHERVFQLFQRLHGRDRYPGTGLGLAICKRVVERHGGRIWIEPGRGRGTRFRFTIPDREGAGQDAPGTARA